MEMCAVQLFGSCASTRTDRLASQRHDDVLVAAAVAVLAAAFTAAAGGDVARVTHAARVVSLSITAALETEA